MGTNNKINIDEMLRRKKERNSTSKKNLRTNVQNINSQIAERHKQNEDELLLGKAQIDLQNKLLDAEYRAVESFNDKYMALASQVIEDYDAQADARAEELNSAVDVQYQVIEEVKEAESVANSLPPRRSRFTNTLFASDTEELNVLPSSQVENTKALSDSDNPFSKLKKPS